MNVLPKEKQIAVITALVEGNSIRSTERMCQVHRDTIMRLLVRVGEHCETLSARLLTGIKCQTLQLDEIWSFCGKKQHRLTPQEALNTEMGDQWTFVALDPVSKLVPAWAMGKRNWYTAMRFLNILKPRLADPASVQLNTDSFKAYRPAIQMVFGPEANHAQMIKYYANDHIGPGRYSPPRVARVQAMAISGSPRRDLISTSHVERQNLNMRMSMRRYTRLTNAFSRKLTNLEANVSLHFGYYNFVRTHISLGACPAVSAGAIQEPLSIADLIPPAAADQSRDLAQVAA